MLTFLPFRVLRFFKITADDKIHSNENYSRINLRFESRAMIQWDGSVHLWAYICSMHIVLEEQLSKLQKKLGDCKLRLAINWKQGGWGSVVVHIIINLIKLYLGQFFYLIHFNLSSQ